VGKAAWEFFAERTTFDSWAGEETIPLEVERLPPASESSGKAR
jgi:hypothetical protein